MKVLVLAPFPIPYSRGSSLKALETAEMVAESKGVEKVTLVSYGSPESCKKDKIEFRPIRIIYTPTGFSFKRAFCVLLLFLKALSLMRRERYDLIHAHNVESGFAAVALKRIFGVPVLLDLHGDLRSELLATRKLVAVLMALFVTPAERCVLKMADRTVVINSLWARYLRRKGIKDVETIYPTSRVEKPGTDENLKDVLGIGRGKVVLYSGSFREYQGLDLLIEAARMVIEKGDDVRFILIGDDPGGKYKKLVKGMGMGDKFIFTGFLQKQTLSKYYGIADVLVVPRPESELARFAMPRKITDYMSARKPIVATDVGDHRAMLSSAGIIVKPNAEDIARGILSVIRDKELGLRMGRLAYERLIREYSWQKTRGKFIGAYKKMTRRLS